MSHHKSENYMKWKAWVEKNHHLMQHPADFEAQFVLEVLSLVPDITTDHVIPQYEFTDSTNKTRRIDFVILDETRGLGLAIELDGLTKLEEQETRTTNYRKFDDLLARQNDLLSKTKGRIFMLFRFSNKRWLKDPKSVARQITEELKEEYTAYQTMLKHNRFAQDVEKNLLRARQERDQLQQQLQKIQQELDAERRKGTVSGAENSLVREQSRLSDALNAMAQQYDSLNSQFDQFQRELEANRKNLARERQFRMEEQQKRDALDEPQVATTNGSNKFNNYLLVACLIIIAVGATAFFMNKKDNAAPVPAQTAVQEQQVMPSPSAPTISAPTQAPGAQSFSSSEAGAHIGETATVCGTLVEIKQLDSVTFLNFDAKYPNNLFTAAVADQYANQFLGINKSVGSKICVNGKIRTYGRKCGIELQYKSQLEK